MRTVKEALHAFCVENGISLEECLGTYFSRIDGTMPQRYRALVQGIVLQLPEDWDRHATWSMTVNDDESPMGYAHAFREEESEGDYCQCWEVVLYPRMLDRLSDAACRYVIAHELAHVASGVPPGSIVIEGRPYTRIKGTADQYQEAPSKSLHEDVADTIALEWGFSEEAQAFLREDS